MEKYATRTVTGRKENQGAKLENILCLELDHPRQAAAERGSDNAIHVRQAQVLMVVDVEDLGLNVQHAALGNRRQLVDRGVQFVKTRSSHVIVRDVVPVIALQAGLQGVGLSRIRTSRRRIVNAGIKPFLARSLAFRQYAGLAWR